MAHRVELTVPDEMWQAIEAAREDVPRAAWIKWAINLGLERTDESAPLGPIMDQMSEALSALRTAVAAVERESG